MFTAEEQPLLTGSDDEVSEFVDCSRCMIVDWRGTEQEAADDVIRFLPHGALTYEETFPGNDTIAIHLCFLDRRDSFSLPFQPQNNFRVLLRIRQLLQPDYDIQLFRCTEGSDTHGFLLRSRGWWAEYCSKYQEQRRKVFQDISDLNGLWGLDAPPKPDGPETKTKPWWRFW